MPNITIGEVAKKRLETDLLVYNKVVAQRTWENIRDSIPEYANYLAAKDAAEQAEDNLTLFESQYKAERIEEFKKTKEKSYPGGTIQVRKSYSYNEAIIIPFLREHKHDDLIKESIDKTKVKKLSEAMNVPGITVSENIIATLNDKLNEFLEDENA